jgi:hypothetical protein
MSWKRKVGIAAGLVLLAVVLGIAGLRVAWDRRLQAVRSGLLARGERLDLLSIAPRRPPALENGYRDLVDAQAAIPEPERLVALSPPHWLTTNGTALRLADLESWISQDAPLSSRTNRVRWADLESRLQAQREPLVRVRAALARPYVDGAPDYSRGMQLLLPHLAPLKRLAGCLAVSADASIRAGRPAEAAEDIEAILRLARHLQRETVLISQLVGLAIQMIALPPTWQLLEDGRAADPDLDRVQKAWQSIGPPQSMAPALEFERAAALGVLEKARASSSNYLAVVELGFGGAPAVLQGPATGKQLLEFLGEAPANTGMTLRALLWRHLFAPADEASMLGLFQMEVEVHRRFGAGDPVVLVSPLAAAVTNQLAALQSGVLGGLRSVMTADMVASVQGTLVRVARAEAQRRMAIAAIALRRHRLATGRDAERLEALAAWGLPSVPVDPYDGRPLRYRRLPAEGRFLLYCVGENLVDDGGRLTPENLTDTGPRFSRALSGSPDMVWPMPATSQEARDLEEARVRLESSSRRR